MMERLTIRWSRLEEGLGFSVLVKFHHCTLALYSMNEMAPSTTADTIINTYLKTLQVT